MLGKDGLHPSALAVALALESRGVVGPVHQFETSTKTAVEAATALGCDVGAIASCLVFVLDDEPVVIIKSGAFRVDTDRFLVSVGGTHMRRADADEVRQSTGQPIGGVSPVNWPGPLRVFIDDYLSRFDQIWSACGTPHAVFATSFGELVELTRAVPVNFEVLPN
ncbi:MAG: YbaK/EbsC family protein [Acidimicrobiaceae bacterium]|nr:YbaK/EbsC family protein [Acidimicrobiaceae bacterium]